MNIGLALHELAVRYGLSASSARQLQQLAWKEPAGLAQALPRLLVMVAAALGGFGVILWVAAHWADFGRAARFGLLQAVVLAGALGWLAWPRARAALGLLTLLATGGLWACFGQTYQTGADPWQLFALWAAMTAPLCWAARSDVLWAPWTLVAATAVSLWLDAEVGGWHWGGDSQLRLHLAAWAACWALAALLSPALSKWTGAGRWSFRLAAAFAAAVMGVIALEALYRTGVGLQYPLGLALFVVGIAVLSRWAFDAFALGAFLLGADVLLLCGAADAMFDKGADSLGAYFILTLLAAGLMTASVQILMALTRRHARSQPQPQAQARS